MFWCDNSYLCGNKHDRESVVSLGANCLNRGCGDARFVGDHLVELADSLDARVRAIHVDHPAIANHVIANDNTDTPWKLQSPCEEIWNKRIARHDEDKIK